MIMNVAVPFPKHSLIFGQLASSQTVWSRFSRRIVLISWNLDEAGANLTRIQSGFFSAGTASTLIGIRAVLAAPFCLSMGSMTMLAGAGSVIRIGV